MKLTVGILIEYHKLLLVYVIQYFVGSVDVDFVDIDAGVDPLSLWKCLAAIDVLKERAL